MNSEHFIHPLALVDDSCTIGAGTRIWQFASVIRGTVLGENCNVAHGACLDGPRFGDRCIISHNVAMGPGFVISDDVFIGPGVVFCNDMWPSARKDLGPFPDNHWDIKTFQDGGVTIRVGKNVIIGANATILPGITIGDGGVVAAGAVCNKDVPCMMVFTRDGKLKLRKPEHEKRMWII